MERIKNNTSKMNIVAGILFVLLASANLFLTVFRSGFYALNLFALLLPFAYIVMAVCLFIRKPAAAAAGAAVMAFCVIARFLRTVPMYLSAGISIQFPFFVQTIFTVACYVLLAVTAGAKLAKKKKFLAFLPAVLFLIVFLFSARSGGGMFRLFWHNLWNRRGSIPRKILLPEC